MLKAYKFIEKYRDLYIYKGYKYFVISRIKSEHFNVNMIMYDYFVNIEDARNFIDEIL